MHSSSENLGRNGNTEQSLSSPWASAESLISCKARQSGSIDYEFSPNKARACHFYEVNMKKLLLMLPVVASANTMILGPEGSTYIQDLGVNGFNILDKNGITSVKDYGGYLQIIEPDGSATTIIDSVPNARGVEPALEVAPDLVVPYYW